MAGEHFYFVAAEWVSSAPPLAFFDPGPAREIGLMAGVILTIAGMLLHWQLPRQRMTAEERMKDGKLTETEANRMIRLYRVSAPVLTIAGAVLLVGVLADYLR